MEYFKEYIVIKELYSKHDRSVLLVQPKIPSPSLPDKYVIKTVKSNINECREAIIHKKLSDSNPTLLKFYDSWHINDTFYICIEYCDRQDLHTLLKSTRFEFDQVLDLCYQLALTVQSMHNQCICHRDIKGLNIFVTQDWKLKLGDFGLSKVVMDTETLNTVLGTPPYMSPELIRKFKCESDDCQNPYRDDIWALGKTFFEIATGCCFLRNMKSEEFYREIDLRFGENGKCRQLGMIIKDMMTKNKNEFIWIDKVVGRLEKLMEKIELEKFRCKSGNLSADSHRFEDFKEELKVNNIMNSPLLIIKEKSDFISHSSMPSNTNLTTSTLNFSIISKNNEDCLSNFIYTDSIDSFKTEIKADSIVSLSSRIRPNTDLTALNLSETSNSDESHQSNFTYSIESSKTEMKIDSIVSPSIQNPTESLLNKIIPLTCKNSEIVPEPNPKFYNTGMPKIKRLTKLTISSADSLLISPIKKVIVYCCSCQKEIHEAKLEIECKHFYHQSCFINLFDEKLRKAKNKTQEFKCVSCGALIGFEFLTSFDHFSTEAKKYAKLQYYSRVNTVCPQCNTTSERFIVNSKFKFSSVKCLKCKIKYCSFCNFRASHSFNCDALNDFYENHRK